MDIPEEINLEADGKLLPEKSKSRYEKELNLFNEWRKAEAVDILNETVMLAYVSTLSKSFKASTLWTKFSMLKTALIVNGDVDISRYGKVIAFMKSQNINHTPKKSRILSVEQCRKFISEASDEFLLCKVVLIFGLYGACRRDELLKLTVDDIEDHEKYILVKLQNTSRSFVIPDSSESLNPYEIFQKYFKLRPLDVGCRRLFLGYRQGKCIAQPAGMHTIGGVPRKVAKFLDLAHPENYTGHSLRRSGVSMVSESCGNLLPVKQSSKVAEGYIEQTTRSKMEVAKMILSTDSSHSRSTIVSSDKFDVASCSREEISTSTNISHTNPEPPSGFVITGNSNCTIKIIIIMEQAIGKSVPEKSRERYEYEGNLFKKWQQENHIENVCEKVIMAYIDKLSEIYAPNSLCTKISMLKTMLQAEENIDIGKFQKVNSYLRQNSAGYIPKKSKILNQTEVLKFLNEAPDDDYLMQKVVLIFGIFGACRRTELTYMKVSNIEDRGSVVVVNIPKTKNYKKRSFCLLDDHEFSAMKFYRKYAALRPTLTGHDRFFLCYKKGRCTRQVVGKNSIGNIPCKIATFLGLKDAPLYTGHCMRRSSVDGGEDIVGLKRLGGWKGTIIAEDYIDDSRMSRFTLGGTSVSKCSGDTVKAQSTSVLSSSENETTNDRAYSIGEDPLGDDTNHEDDDDEDSDVEDKNVQMCDVSETEIVQNEFVEPLRVTVESEEENCVNAKECDLFGEYIAKILQRLPLDVALKLQSGIQSLVLQTRLEYIREHPNEAPIIVKEEHPQANSTPTPEDLLLNTIDSDGEALHSNNNSNKEKRSSQKSEQPTKRFKPNTSGQETNKPNRRSIQNQNKRTEYTVFAEHIALQLEQLPEDVSIQLQTEIYDLITQTYSKQPNRVKIKDEVVPDVEDSLDS